MASSILTFLWHFLHRLYGIPTASGSSLTSRGLPLVPVPCTLILWKYHLPAVMQVSGVQLNLCLSGQKQKNKSRRGWAFSYFEASVSNPLMM